MPSTYTANLGIELPADGELDGVWGDVTNENMDILDRAINGVLSLSLSGTSSTLTTSDGALSDGQFKLLLLTGSPSGTHTITISPADADKIYFVRNTTAQSVVFTQGSGGNVTIATGDSGIIYADGAGASAAVANLTDHFAMSSVNITGGSITGLADLGLSSTIPFIDFDETDTTDKDARISLSAGTLVFDTRTDAGVLVQENMRIASNGYVGIGTNADADTQLEVFSNTNPTALFIAYISGTTMTVTGITSGALAVGDRVFGTGVEWNTVITAQLTGATGASGNYTVNNSQTVSTAPGIAMSSGNAGKSVLRLTNRDSSEATNQTTGAIEFFSSDASTPGAGVKGYVAVIAESATPDSAMIFGTSDNTASTLAVERMRINSAGNVGIGTKSPVYPLHVYLTDATTYGDGTGALDTTNLITVQNASQVDDTYSGIRLVSESTAGTTGWWSIASISTSSNYDNHLVFHTRTGNSTYAERMRIDNEGRVGINKAVPTVALDVVGAGSFTANLAVDTDTLLVDAVNDRVGINKAVPTVALDVVGAISSTGTISNSIGQLYSLRDVRYFTSGTAATYTPTAGTKAIRVTCAGGGGGGGGTDGQGAGTGGAAAGGGAGGVTDIFISSLAATYTYTVGAAGAGGVAGANTGSTGGTTTFSGTGVSLSAAGGAGGSGRTASSSSGARANGGAGGSASGGDLNVAGSSGMDGSSAVTLTSVGNGGPSPYGSFGAGFGINGPSTAAGAGAAASGRNAGGGGASVVGATDNDAGGAGAGGLIIIEEMA